MDELTHKVTIEISGRFAKTHTSQASVTIHGDGGLEHMLHAFEAALVAAGFPPETAAQLRERME